MADLHPDVLHESLPLLPAHLASAPRAEYKINKRACKIVWCLDYFNFEIRIGNILQALSSFVGRRSDRIYTDPFYVPEKKPPLACIACMPAKRAGLHARMREAEWLFQPRQPFVIVQLGTGLMGT